MSDKPKHLLLTLEYPPDGAGVGVYLENLVANNRSYEIKVVSGDLYYRWLWPRWLKSFFVLARARRDFNFTVLHISHILPLGYVALLAKWFWGIKYVVYLHGLDFNLAQKTRWKKFWTRVILHRAAVIVANSNFLKDKIVKFSGGKVPVEVIYPAPNKRLLGYQAGEDKVLAIKGQYDIKDNTPVFLSVGRLIGRKGQQLALAALKNLSEKIPGFDFRYIIVGAGPEENNLEKLIEDNNLKDKVFLAGMVRAQDGLADYYRAADIFVMPTIVSGGDEEGFGIVYLEAGMFGLPVIGGQGKGVREAVSDGVTGLIASTQEELAAAMAKLVKDYELRRRLGEAGKLHVQKFIYPEDFLFKKIGRYL